MFGSLREFFDDIAGPPRTDPAADEQRLRVAVAVLLVEVMRAEDGVTAQEREAVTAALGNHFGAGGQLEQLVVLAQEASRTANDFFQFTNTLNERFSRDQKIQVIEEMWRVAYADGHLGTLENSVIARVSDLLHVTHGEYIAAKVRAQEATRSR
ncbi:MAG TPA: TerB family tellurite resistance protein [Ramlibacter sp.]